jgi:CRISPR/Cas system-associated exonuclease Cas4 (RecB family)
MTKIVGSNNIQSLTDLLLKTLNKTNGQLVRTEIELERDGLRGRIDVLWEVDNGYIIQEEKTSEPPKDKIAWEEDLLQLDAYAFLAEESEYSPVVDGIIIYNDLKPRKVKPDPDHAVEVLREAIWLLENDSLPEEKGNKTICKKCSYYALCQVLPKEGGLTANEIRNAFATQLTGIIQH